MLTHRTYEMKASLEPKEQQIESLKQNLSDLTRLYEMQMKSLKQMDANVQAKKDAILALDKKLKKAKVTTKNLEHKIQEFVQDIQKTMQKAEDSEKIAGLMRIYKTHVKKQPDEVFAKKQKDPETIDELDKHLKYMEKQIRILQDTTAKNLKKSKQHIIERTEENKDLIASLSELREQDRQRKKDQERVDKQINEINQQKRRIGGEIDKMKEEMKKMRQQEGTKAGFHRASSVYTRAKPEDQQVADQFRKSQSKGRLIKGSLFNNKPVGLYKQQI